MVPSFQISLYSVFKVDQIHSILIKSYIYNIFLLASANVNHPNRNGTYISIYLASTNTLVWQIDAGYSTDVIYTGNTVSFQVQNASWTPGATYYILFSSGTASGVAFCGPESAPITGIYVLLSVNLD